MEYEQKTFMLNDEQQKAAYCNENAVVAAGAGSGKTMVLASRYVWLITEKKYRVREILTLTFTRKAAAQMYRRIYHLLSKAAVEENEEKGRLAKRAIDEFSQERIQTLDSYCSAILRQAANRYGLKADFNIDNDTCLQLAYDEALPFLIANRNHPAIECLFYQKSPIGIANDFFTLPLFNLTYINKNPDPKNYFNIQFNFVCNEWKRQSEIIINKLQELCELYIENEKYHPDFGILINQCRGAEVLFPSQEELDNFYNELILVPNNSLVSWVAAHPLQKIIIKVLEFIASLTVLDMRKGSPRNNPLKNILYEIRDLFGEFSSLGVFLLQSGLIYSLLILFSELQISYLERKRSMGVLTFNDVEHLARTILLCQHDIRQSEKSAFKAIMIDEFQDNNELQKDILFLISEKPDIINNTVPASTDITPGKLFFVGDEKQSIYRFRGADVSVFRKLRKEFKRKDELSPDLTLKINYRSAAGLIGAFNTIFGGNEFNPQGNITKVNTNEAERKLYPSVFIKELSNLKITLPAFEASYSELQGDKKKEGKLSLCILDKNNSDDSVGILPEHLESVENEARFIAEKIAFLLNEKNDDGGQKYLPGDIAILFRSRSPQHYFEKHLMLLNIPYVNEDLKGFFFGGPVNDLYSVLRLAVYPMDKAAYAQMLRSPFVGISLSGLAICLSDQNYITGNFSPFGSNTLSILDEEDKIKFTHGQRIYQKILDLSCKVSVSSLLNELWYGEGYRYETEWNPVTAVYRELYDYFFYLAALADQDNISLASFVDSVQSLYNNDDLLKNIEIPLERPSAVHLLTIHKSKGLEFPVVFICCCDKKGRNEVSDDIFDTNYAGLTINPPLPFECEGIKNIRRSFFWERSLALEKDKRTAELRRLLYVAMTRAENELYLSGCLDISRLSKKENKKMNSDFSLSLKQYINEKILKSGEEYNPAYDSKIDGNSFFGLCLPAFGAHISDKGLEEESSFFTIEKIPSYDEEYILGAEDIGSRFSNDQKGLNAFFKITKPDYTDIKIIETPVVSKRHFSPTSLPLMAKLKGEFILNNEYKGIDTKSIFISVDALLSGYIKKDGEEGEKFSSADFGTITHICVEALLSGLEAQIPSRIAGFLSPNDADLFLKAGMEIAYFFCQSPLGIIAACAEQRRCEFPFRSLITGEDDFFISGTMDLVFEDSKTIYVVDFKTDRQEEPLDYLQQMTCYIRAAKDLFALKKNKKCRTLLYYLRTGNTYELI